MRVWAKKEEKIKDRNKQNKRKRKTKVNKLQKPNCYFFFVFKVYHHFDRLKSTWTELEKLYTISFLLDWNCRADNQIKERERGSENKTQEIPIRQNGFGLVFLVRSFVFFYLWHYFRMHNKWNRQICGNHKIKIWKKLFFSLQKEFSTRISNLAKSCEEKYYISKL